MTVPRTPSATALWIAGILTVAASVFLTMVGAALVRALWLVITTLIAWAGWGLRHTPSAVRVILSGALVPLLVLLTWEGGLFFVPAAITLVVANACSPSRPAMRPGPTP